MKYGARSGRPAALVTGAGSGIGAATAMQLAEQGWDVGMVGRRRLPLESVADQVRAQGAEAYVIPADLAEAGAPAEVVEKLAAAAGRIDGLVANAAITCHRPIEEWLVEDFDEHVAVNVRAFYFLVQSALPWLRQTPEAAIVTVSSSSGTLVRSPQSVYGMTKAGLEYLTRSFAAELAPERIRVNCVAPGPVDTPIHATYADDLEAAYEWLADQAPLGRIGTPKELARWITLLLAPCCGFVTGAVVPVDGGQTLDYR